jgi:hypothetical protein
MDIKFSLERVSGSVNLEEIGQPASTIVSLVCDTRFKELLKVTSEGLCAYLDIIKVHTVHYVSHANVTRFTMESARLSYQSITNLACEIY